MNDLLTWLSANATTISAVASMLMFFVWVTYLHLTYSSFMRARRPRLIIHHAQGSKLDSSCLLINMSQEPIHVVCVMVVGGVAGEKVIRQVTDYQHVSLAEKTPSEWQSIIKQGPLSPGGFMLLGTFNSLLDSLAERIDEEELPSRVPRKEDGTPVVEILEVRVIAVFGPEDRPIGAYRRFSLKLKHDRVMVRPRCLSLSNFSPAPSGGWRNAGWTTA